VTAVRIGGAPLTIAESVVGHTEFLEAQQRRRNVANARRITDDAQPLPGIPPRPSPPDVDCERADADSDPVTAAKAVAVEAAPVARWRARRPLVPKR
jgi:hypothetical protein